MPAGQDCRDADRKHAGRVRSRGQIGTHGAERIFFQAGDLCLGNANHFRHFHLGFTGKEASDEGSQQAFGEGEDDCKLTFRSEYPGRQGADTEGSGTDARNFPVLYFQTGKEDYEAVKKRN